MKDPVKILYKRSASKVELRAALAQALGMPLPSWSATGYNLVQACRGYFSDRYSYVTDLEYSFGAKDHAALRGLVDKLSGAVSRKNPLANEHDVYNAFVYLIRNLPPWYQGAGFSLSIINAKYNEIIAQLKNERNNKKGAGKLGVSDDYLSALARDIRS